MDRADEPRTYAKEYLMGPVLAMRTCIHWFGWKTFAYRMAKYKVFGD